MIFPSILKTVNTTCKSPSQKQPHRGVPRKRCSENMQQVYRRTPMPRCDLNKVALLCNLIEIALWHGCSPVNLLHIFSTPFLKNTSGWLLLPNLMTKLSISEFDSNMQCFRIQLDRIQLDIFWTSFKDQIIRSVKPDQQFEKGIGKKLVMTPWSRDPW